MKKAALLIVEGVSEETALAVPLLRLFDKQTLEESVKFQVVHGDITADKDTKTTNAKTRVVKTVKDFLSKSKLLVSDLTEIVLLVDTDGAYIPDDAIEENPAYSRLFYSENGILCKDKEDTIARNLRKKTNLSRLSSSQDCNIGGRKIPFSVYFFSSNLDHVLHNNSNLTRKEKVDLADAFQLRYADNLPGLLIFFNDSAIAKGATYNESWAYIQERTNSLQRGTNFHIFLSPQAARVPRDFSKLL